jgi:putative transposase
VLAHDAEVHRRPLRLRDFDYSPLGLYFVTTCANGRRCVFGTVADDSVVLSPLGVIAHECLLSISDHHPGVLLDAYVVMPNHVHAVLALGAESSSELGVVVGTFKAAVSRLSVEVGLWQRGYYDHVVRDEPDLARIRLYIESNPIHWALDPENPDRLTKGDRYVAPTRCW